MIYPRINHSKLPEFIRYDKWFEVVRGHRAVTFFFGFHQLRVTW